jgi:hypothetical protein
MRKLLLALAACLLFATPVLADGDGVEIMGIQTHPYTAFTMTRVSEVSSWSPGFRLGAEIDLGKGEGTQAFLSIDLWMHDILAEDEVYEWDSDVTLGLGVYW